LENVRGHLSLGLKEVLQDLTDIGYNAEWRTVRASDTGAPHRRERIFIVAQPTNSNSERLSLGHNQSGEIRDQGEPQLEPSQLVEAIASDSSSKRLQGSVRQGLRHEQSSVIDSYSDNKHQSHDRSMSKLGSRFVSRREMHLQSPPNALDEAGKLNSLFVEYMMGLPKGWVTDCGLSRAQTLKMLGNGVVPQQAKLALELMV
jgi:DNA (cytosine-5)-methyltransferase 1